MAEINQQQIRALRHGGRLKWTTKMNSYLLKYIRRAKEMANSNDPPRYSDGQKRGYMSIMKELWDQSSYSGLNISAQNLRNQAAYVERSLGNVAEMIREDILARNKEQIEDRSERRPWKKVLFREIIINATATAKSKSNTCILKVTCQHCQGMAQRLLTMK